LLLLSPRTFDKRVACACASSPAVPWTAPLRAARALRSVLRHRGPPPLSHKRPLPVPCDSIAHTPGLFCAVNWGRTVQAQAGPRPGAVPAPWTSAGVDTSVRARERLPGAPSSRRRSRRCRCGARRGGTLHGCSSAGLCGLAHVRCCLRRPGRLLSLATMGS
jgi:hypothetical protein